jgi:hypothetical protein
MFGWFKGSERAKCSNSTVLLLKKEWIVKSKSSNKK